MKGATSDTLPRNRGSILTCDRASFFEHAMRIVAADYLPNEMDVLRARTKTTGIYETRFEMGQLSIQ